MEDTKIKDEDLALLNSLRGKWVVFAPGAAHQQDSLVVIVDSETDGKAVVLWCDESTPWFHYTGSSEGVIKHHDSNDREALLDRLREIVNERGMVREEVGRHLDKLDRTVPE